MANTRTQDQRDRRTSETPRGLSAALVAYFLFWAFRGASTYLNPDDLTTIYHSLEVPFASIVKGVVFFWSGQLRPLGALYYRTLYELAGMNAAPYRYVSLSLLIINLLLALRFLKLLTRSNEIAFLAAFFGCFHSSLWDIFSSSGSIFDVFCFTFYLAALNYYVAIRNRGVIPSARQIAALCVFTALALDAKEMGATIPMMLLCYEAIFQWESRSLRTVTATGLVVLAFVAGWALHVTVNTGNPAYAPLLTSARYLETTRVYVTHLFAEAIPFTEVTAVCFLAVTFGIALWARSRFLLFGWLFYVVTLLPMSFIPPRATGYALYLPIVGSALYLAALFIWIVDRLQIQPQWRAICIAGFLTLAAYSHYREDRYLVQTNAGPGGHLQTRQLVDDFQRLYPKLPHDIRILLVDDPFQNLLWQPIFAVRLLYRDFSLKIYRTPIPGPVVSEDGVYDLVLVWRDGHYQPRQ